VVAPPAVHTEAQKVVEDKMNEQGKLILAVILSVFRSDLIVRNGNYV
jgi:hypothetical protein